MKALSGFLVIQSIYIMLQSFIGRVCRRVS